MWLLIVIGLVFTGCYNCEQPPSSNGLSLITTYINIPDRCKRYEVFPNEIVNELLVHIRLLSTFDNQKTGTRHTPYFHYPSLLLGLMRHIHCFHCSPPSLPPLTSLTGVIRQTHNFHCLPRRSGPSNTPTASTALPLGWGVGC
jgi:hypothetical protein